MIGSLCLKGFNKEMIIARVMPPPKMAEFTCECFLKEIKNGQPVDYAKSICTEKAYQKFIKKSSTWWINHVIAKLNRKLYLFILYIYLPSRP